MQKKLWDEERTQVIQGLIRDTEKALYGLAKLTCRIIEWIPPDPKSFPGCTGNIEHQDLYDLWREALRVTSKSVGAITFESNLVLTTLKSKLHTAQHFWKSE